jgi:hypothetical protein
MTMRRCQPAIPTQPSWPARLKRAADQDRTGIISLEGRFAVVEAGSNQENVLIESILE